MKFIRFSLAFIAICCFAFGCAPSDETVTEQSGVTFQGKPDPRLFGKWQAEPAGTSYEFKEDGSYHLSGTVKTQGGTFKNESDGSWAVDGEKLLVKDQAGNVTPYKLSIEGSKVTLTLTGSLKNQTVLKKQ